MYDIDVLSCGYILKYKEQMFKNVICLFLTTLSLCCFELAVSSCGRGLLAAVGSPLVEHGCASFSSCGSPRPSCPMACGIFPDQGSNPWLLHWQADSQPLDHQGRPEEQIHVLKILILTWIGGKMKMEVESVICSSPPVIQPYMLCKIKKKKNLSFT